MSVSSMATGLDTSHDSFTRERGQKQVTEKSVTPRGSPDPLGHTRYLPDCLALKGCVFLV